MRVGSLEERLGIKVLTQEQCHHIHLSSLEILERTGIIVHDREARKIYQDGGAMVQEERVYIPAFMVREALSTAPESFSLFQRDGETPLLLEENHISYGPGTDLPHFREHKRGLIQDTCYQDIVDVARVTEHLQGMDFVASLGLARDVTPKLADLYHFKAMVENTRKPIFTTASDRENLMALIEMASLCRGGQKDLQERPLMLLYTEPISPLINSREAHQKLITAATYRIPVTYAAGIASGSTGPVTLVGNFALGNAEGLAGLVLHQLVRPGAPFLYGIVPSPLDMQTTIVLYGGPEMPLSYCLAGEMGHFYGLPVFGQSGCTDSPILDEQAAIEASFSILVAAMSGTNLIHDNGYLGNGLVGSLEMLIFCNESILMAQHFMKTMELSKETMALDLIHEVGPQGSYLKTDHTRKHFQSEQWFSRLLNRDTYETWVKKGEKRMEEKIKEEVDRILEEEEINLLPERLRCKLDSIIEREEERIAREERD